MSRWQPKLDLRPSERLTLAALALLGGLTLVLRPSGWPWRALAFAALLLVAGLASLRPRGRWAWARPLAPVLAVLGCYLLLQPLVATLHPQRWDAALAAADARWFPGLVSAWRNALGRPPWFTDLVYLAYASFYFLPIAAAALILARKGEAAFEAAAFQLLLGFYLSFLGYFLWPAEGPRIPQSQEAALLGGGAVAHGVRTFLRTAETTTLDAFPSGHTALSILPAWLATRALGRRAWPFWPWAGAVAFATVYISAHYAVDVLAGLVLAALVPAVSRPVRRWLGG